jgi:hypothetical protein
VNRIREDPGSEQVNERAFALGFDVPAVGARGYSDAVIWIADAHREPGKKIVIRSDEILTAFLEPEKVTRESLRLSKVQ